MSAGRAAIGLGLCTLLLAVSVTLQPPPAMRPPAPALVAPFLELAAQVQWIRFQRARLRGEPVRALSFAERALDLDPASTAGWEALAGHLALDLASAEREPAVERRRQLFAAARDVLRRGAERAREPGELERYAGLLALSKAEADPAIDADGARGLYRMAAADFERAAATGVEDGSELARQARELAER